MTLRTAPGARGRLSRHPSESDRPAASPQRLPLTAAGCSLPTARLPRGTGAVRYRCFLPDLTGFAGPTCTGPDCQQSTSRPPTMFIERGPVFSRFSGLPPDTATEADVFALRWPATASRNLSACSSRLSASSRSGKRRRSPPHRGSDWQGSSRRSGLAVRRVLRFPRGVWGPGNGRAVEVVQVVDPVASNTGGEGGIRTPVTRR